jgi:2-keto-4-pentenoate hydratase
MVGASSRSRLTPGSSRPGGRSHIARATRSLLCFLLFASQAAHAADDVEALAAAIRDAVALGRPVPDVPDDLAEAAAYRVQATWVNALYSGPAAGYKAGLTSPGAQQRFGVHTPVMGVLPSIARLASGTEVEAGAGLVVEVEIGVLVGTDREPAALVPAVELPRLRFAAPDGLALADVIAANVSADRFVVGSARLVDPDVRGIRVTLERDGTVVNEGIAADALGDPLASYRWVVGRAADIGYPLEEGMIVLTGALGRIADGLPGNYVARYGDLGEVRFTIR